MDIDINQIINHLNQVETALQQLTTESMYIKQVCISYGSANSITVIRTERVIGERSLSICLFCCIPFVLVPFHFFSSSSYGLSSKIDSMLHLWLTASLGKENWIHHCREGDRKPFHSLTQEVMAIHSLLTMDWDVWRAVITYVLYWHDI